jgi:hypothetical protein
LLSIFADKVYRKNKKISIAISVLNVLMLSVFAGIRSFSVGKDISVYGLSRFESELSSKSFFNRLGNYSQPEYGYYFANYVVSRFTRDYHVFLFIHQLFLSTIIHILAYRDKEAKGSPIWLYVTCYLFLWFNTSLNILRQSIALFIQLYSFQFLEKNKSGKYVIATLLAMLFHLSSALFLVVPVLYKFFNKKRGIAQIVVSCMVIVGSFLFIGEIITVLMNYIPSFSKYAAYLNNEGARLSGRYLLYKVIMGVSILAFYISAMNKKENNNAILAAFSAYDIVFYALSGFVMFGYRISYFFLVHDLIFIPRIDAMLSKKNKLLFRMVVLLLLVGYWINRFILSNYDSTLPYRIGI